MINNKYFKLAVAISLIVHLSVVFVHFAKNNQNVVTANSEKKEERVRVIFEEQLRPKKKLQIVQNEEKENTDKPLDSIFLGKTNQKFDRQTVAKNIGEFKNRESELIRPEEKSEKIDKEMVKNGKGKIKLEDLSFSQINIAKFKPKTNKRLNSTGAASTTDYIEDIPLSDMTNLNTTEFKFYGFYHRIRQKLEQYWGNSLREKAELLSRQGRKVASQTDKITSLAIYLDTKGNILKIQLKGTSGIKELDDAAIESFNKAGPFPNPPQGMMNNGVAVIEWGFVVKG